MAAKKLPAGIEQLPSGGYRGRYTGPDRRRYSTPAYPTIEKAVYALSIAKGQVAAGDWLDPARTGITLTQWFDVWLPNKASMRGYVREKEATRYRLHIQPYLGKQPLDRLTPYLIADWHARLAADGRSAATIGKAHALLKAALGPRGGAMADERLTRNPAQLVQPPTAIRKQWRLVTRPEFDRLLHETPEWARPLVLLAAYTGLRWSEIVGLQRADYNPLRNTLTVRRGTVYHHGRLIDGDPKDHQERTVPTMPILAEALKTHLTARPVGHAERLFAAPQGGPLRHPHFMERVYKPAAVRAGLGVYVQQDGQRRYHGVRFHDLRHSCASWLLNGGMDIHEVKELLGHASITTTQEYAHTDKDEMRDAMLKAFG